MIEEDLYRLWESMPLVRDQLGGRVFVGSALQDTPLPYVVLRTTSSVHYYHLTNEDCMRQAMIECIIHGERMKQLDELAELIRLHTSGYYGRAGETWFHSVQIDRDTNLPVFYQDGRTNQYQRTLDLRINFHQQTPIHARC